MLSWSGQQDGAEVELGAVAAGRGDAGIALGSQLLRFATAAAVLRGDPAEMAAARDALGAAGGHAVMVDAAAVAANFHMMTRLADGTGARHSAQRLGDMATTITVMGAGGMLSRR